jgi:hypothetical protein
MYSGQNSEGLNTSYPRSWKSGTTRDILVDSSVEIVSFNMVTLSENCFNDSINSIVNLTFSICKNIY